MNKTLSVIIASYNTKDLTLVAVSSILKQNPKVDYEIIVVDDGSTDGSVEALRQLERRSKNLKIIVNEKNLGYVRTNNKGIEVSVGKYKLLLNSDTEVKKGALEALVEFAQTHQDAGVVGSKLLNPDGTLQSSCYRLPTIKNAILEYWLGRKGFFGKYAPRGKKPVAVEAVVGAAFLLTPQALKKAGMLNLAYKSYFEDLDYCRAVRHKGLKVYYLPEAEIIHYHGASFAKLSDEKNRWRKLVPSSKIYHGLFKHYLLNFIIRIGQKWPKIVWFAAVLLAIPACLAFFHKGFFPTHDYIYVARIQQMFEALKVGQFPVRWASGFRYGEPLYNFYAPLVYYLGALVHTFGFSFLTTAKILYALSFILSGLAMFYLARKFLPKLGSLAIAALYVYAPYRSVDTYVRGAISEAWTFVFFPLIILFTLDVFKNLSRKKMAFLVLSLAGLFLTHNILTVLFLPFYLAFCFCLFINQKNWLFVKRIGLALGLGVGVAATYLIPALWEKGFIQTHYLTDAYFNYLGHFVALRQFIVPSWGYGASLWGPVDDMSFQIGPVHWGVLALALVLFALNFQKIKDRLVKTLFVSSLALFTLSLFFQHNKSTFIWQAIPLLGYVQFPWRFLALSVFFVSLATIPALYLSGAKLAKWLAFLIIVLVLAVNIGYFHPDKYYSDSVDAHYISEETLSVDSKLPKDYLPVWVKVISQEKITEPVVLAGEVQISDFELVGTRAKLSAVSSKGATIEIPVTFFPGWRVSINGRKVAVRSGDDLGLLAFDLPVGKSKVEIRFGNTPVRTVSDLVSLASLVFVVWFYLAKNGKTKKA